MDPVWESMASLAQAIHGFQNGRLSHQEFFAQVDRALSDDDANSARLLDILGQEHTRAMLPPDVYAELRRRIERLMASGTSLAGEETRLQTRPGNHSLPQDFSGRFADTGDHGDHGMGPDTRPASGRMKGVGDTLNGRFVLEECIGFGGMGTVYKALDLRKLEASDRKPYIAIKVLNVQFGAHPQSLIALQREAKKAQTLAHPNIVTVYDFDRDGPMVYLTMEYLSGEPLSHLLRAADFGGMSVDKAMRIVNGIGRALAYAHERGFVHCDLKPANVFVTHRGDVKVIDFGIARVFRQPEEDAEATVFDAGSLGGLTPAYASPEMIEHQVPDPRDDIYALACITYELLTGRHPFNRLSATQARNAGMKPQRPENLSHAQWRALRCALAFDRESRTPTVTRFLDDLGRQRRPVLYVALAGGGIAIGVLIAAALGYYRSQQESHGGAPATASSAQALKRGAAKSEPPPSQASQAAQASTPSLASIAPVLAGLPCSALTASVEGHGVRVGGYLPHEVGDDRLAWMLRGVPGVENVRLDGVQRVSDDKCPMIKLFAPYWIRNRQAGGAAAVRTRQANAELTEGDPLIVDIRTPGQDSYVYVDYYALDGAVAHLVPNPRAKANQAPPNYSAAVGSFGDWVISKPFGTELVVLLTTPVPLFDTIRPAVEPRAEYLRLLDRQLEKIAAKYGNGRIAVDFVQIRTRARQ